MLQSIRMGDGPYGLPHMKFALTYQGELRSRDIPARTWEIRKQFHPQLQDLWRVHPVLIEANRTRFIPSGGPYFTTERHHSLDEGNASPSAPTHGGEHMDLYAPVFVGQRSFVPLVRNSVALRCALKILFMRKEEPGRVYQGGDLDNRLKTLFDALSMPNDQQIVDDPTIENPIYCLLEDDGLITGFDVDTQRLLTQPNASQHEVHLIIEVDVRVVQSRSYNHRFLGD